MSSEVIMKIYPIYHSGFMVELEHHILLFDYYMIRLTPLKNIIPVRGFSRNMETEIIHSNFSYASRPLPSYWITPHFTNPSLSRTCCIR